MKIEGIRRYVFGNPFDTQAVSADIEVSDGTAPIVTVSEDSVVITYSMGKNDKIYGMGEAVRGILSGHRLYGKLQGFYRE